MKQTVLALFLLITVTLGSAAWWFWRDMQAQLHTPLNLATDVDFIIRPGMSLRTVCKELQRTELMPRAYYLALEARRRHQAEQIKAGEYLIKRGTTPLQLLDQFLAGKVKQYALTLIEGWTLAQVFAAIRNHGHLVQTLNPADKSMVARALGLEVQNPEGLFFPDTYHFPANTIDVEVLRKAHQRLQRVLQEEWQQRADDLPYQSPYEALILASLIEKETGLAEERSMIAGVFVRRLQKGMPLQTDPTLIYAMGDNFKGDIRNQDLAIASPYNTYVNTGLPPTPIAMTGRAAIHAALHPRDGTALYFVAKGDGAHYFSDTLTEHNKAVAEYQLGRNRNE